MEVALVCASHSPLMRCYAREPESHEQVIKVFNERAQAISEFDPELVFVFGPDHFNGFFMRLMPAFCIGSAAIALDDIGGTPGKLSVAADTAIACVESVRQAGVDVAASYDMVVDHGFSQTMDRILGGLDRYPVIPVFINAIAKPYVPLKRARLLGLAIGEYARTLDQRVLFLASGGMSHNPRRYYPEFGDGEPEVAGYQLGGTQGDGLDQAAWLARLESMHLEGAQMLVSGKRTRADIKLNPEIDQRFLECLTHDKLEELDDWDPDWLVEQAGIGSLELVTWLAACAANQAAGGLAPQVDIYTETLEYGIATGVIHA